MSDTNTFYAVSGDTPNHSSNPAPIVGNSAASHIQLPVSADTREPLSDSISPLGDSISDSQPLIIARLNAAPAHSLGTKRNSELHGRTFTDLLIEWAEDCWSRATPAMHKRFCDGVWVHPKIGRTPSTTPGSIKLRDWAGDLVVRAARDLGLLAPDSDLVLHVDPPVVVDPISALPEDHPERIRHTIERWRPRTPLADDDETDQEYLALDREWVTIAGPPNMSSAISWLGIVADQIQWADDELGTTDPGFVLHPTNVESGTFDPQREVSDNWRGSSRSILRRVGRAVCPEVWPDEPEIIGVRPVSEPYDPVDEFLFREAALMEGRRSRRERLWMNAGTLGAGLSGVETFNAGPSDLVDLDGGRLGIKVHRGRERIVPIRAQYTELAIEARSLCGSQQRFFESDSKAAAYNLAAKFTVDGLGRLYLPRARATFVCAHIAHGTSARDLDEFAGPLSGTYLRQILDRFVGSVDPREAAKRALGP